jgi:hypothetical protein
MLPYIARGGHICNEKITFQSLPGKDKIKLQSNFENLWAIYGDVQNVTNSF